MRPQQLYFYKIRTRTERCCRRQTDPGERSTRYNRAVNELVFLVEEAPEGGFTARALGVPVFTEADTLDALRVAIRDAVRCHFEVGGEPRILRLHVVREELITP